MRSVLFLAFVLGCAPGPAGTGATTGATNDVTSGSATASTSVATTGAATTTGLPTTGAASTGGSTGPGAPACNGHAELCARRYDEVVFPGTHNSYSARDAGFSQINANQRRTLAVQLAEGVRVLLLDVTTDAGETALCHGLCSLGRIPHAEALADIKAFLDANPREVLTIIYEDDVETAAIAADLVAAGLDARVYTHAGGEFPTLGVMIDMDTRLVVTLENGGPPPAWTHHVWDLAWDTPYTFHSVAEFSCTPNRGDPKNPLFLLNHWISNQLDLPSEADAKTANAFDVLHGRAVQCMQEASDLPNFIAVDFYDQGDLFAVVDALNGV